MLSESCIHIAASSLADMHSAVFHDMLQMYFYCCVRHCCHWMFSELNY